MNNAIWVAIMAANAGRAVASSSRSYAAEISVGTFLIILIVCVLAVFLIWILFEAIDDWIS